MGNNVVEVILAGKDHASGVLNNLDAKLGGIGRIARTAGTAIVGGMAAGAASIVTMARQTATLGDEIEKMSRRTGVSAESLSTLAFAAEQSGSNIGELENGLKRLARNVSDAEAGLTTSVRAFDRLGISIYDANGNLREVDDLLPSVADAMQGLRTDTERAATAQELFGRAGTQLLPMLMEGSKGIRDMQEEARALGREFSTTAARDSAELVDAQNRVRSALQGVRNLLMRDLIPLFAEWSNKIAEAVSKNEGLIGTIRTLLHLATEQGQQEKKLGELSMRRWEIEDRLEEIAERQAGRKNESARLARIETELREELAQIIAEEAELTEQINQHARERAEASAETVGTETEIVELTERQLSLLERTSNLQRGELTWEIQARDKVNIRYRELRKIQQQTITEGRQGFTQMGHEFQTVFQGTSQDAFRGFLRTGQLTMRQFVDYTLQQLGRVAAHRVFMFLAETALSGGSNLFGQVFGGLGGLFRATGGPVHQFTMPEVPKFAGGIGFVPGYGTGDTVPAMLTPGEGIIPRDQMSRLLAGATGGGGGTPLYVTFESLVPYTAAQRVDAVRWLNDVLDERDESY